MVGATDDEAGKKIRMPLTQMCHAVSRIVFLHRLCSTTDVEPGTLSTISKLDEFVPTVAALVLAGRCNTLGDAHPASLSSMHSVGKARLAVGSYSSAETLVQLHRSPCMMRTFFTRLSSVFPAH